ncbi:MAG: hypothetical protein HYT85_11110 [candidate division NC10 bacterium]|nr:hypothetical protein [candidate division NC10 bacterium]MBI2458270.1 hypothetical protein [candidate division NC10 bacterium]MBI3084696.1 hypothetical protein [candidate division NC10 bacterium]
MERQRWWWRRRQVIVDLPFQLKCGLFTVGSVLVYTLVFGFLIFYPLQQELTAAPSIQERARIAREILAIHRRIWPGMLTVSLLAGLHLFVVSHRIAGPVYKVRRTIEEMLRGKLPERFTLRRTDAFRHLEEVVRALADHLRDFSARSPGVDPQTLEGVRALCAAVLADPQAQPELQQQARALAARLGISAG